MYFSYAGGYGRLSAVFLISQRFLNFQKTLVIPLFYPDALDKAADEIRRILPTGMDLTYVRQALYLGILLGPDSVDQGWHSALTKFRSRCSQWEQMHLGVHLDVLVYKAFLLIHPPTLPPILQADSRSSPGGGGGAQDPLQGTRQLAITEGFSFIEVPFGLHILPPVRGTPFSGGQVPPISKGTVSFIQ